MPDGNWNVTTLVNTSGAVVERLEYDPYGQTTWLTSDFEPQTESQFDWETTYCSYRWEAGVSLFQVRFRWYTPQLGVWITRDLSGYIDGNNLYHPYFAPSHIDPSGTKKIWFEFHGFIPKDHGIVFPAQDPKNKQPGTWILALGRYYATDDRNFGGGTSRIYYRGWIESTKLGAAGHGDWEGVAGTSGSTEIYEYFDKKTSSWKINKRAKHTIVKHSAKVFNGPDGTTLQLSAVGNDPLVTLSPNLNFTVRFNFNRHCQTPQKTEVSVNGTHDAYPNYEAMVSSAHSGIKVPLKEESIYQYSSKDPGGPAGLFVGLNHSVSFSGKTHTIDEPTGIDTRLP